MENEDCQIYLCIYIRRECQQRATTGRPAAYTNLLECVFSSDINVCENVPSGAGRKGGARPTNPLGGAPHQVDGADRCEGVIVAIGRDHIVTGSTWFRPRVGYTKTITTC